MFHHSCLIQLFKISPIGAMEKLLPYLPSQKIMTDRPTNRPINQATDGDYSSNSEVTHPIKNKYRVFFLNTQHNCTELYHYEQTVTNLKDT